MLPEDPAASQGPLHRVMDKLSERLRVLYPPARFQHEVLPAPLTDKSFGAIAAVRAPFVGLAFLGLQDLSGARTLQANVRLGLYLVTQATRHRSRLLGDAQAPGLAQMLHVAIIGLHGWTIGGARDGAAGSVEFQQVDTVEGGAWSREHQALCSIVLQTRCAWTAQEADELRRLASTWTFDGPTEAAAETWERPE
jgi:hypothetical protein